MGDGPVATSFPFILRLFEMLTSIIAFSVIVVYEGSSKYNYIMFTGIAGLVVSFFYLLLYLAGNQAIRGKISAVIDFCMWAFWLAAAAVATSLLTSQFTDNSRTQASCAFCWITWVAWTASLIISVREVQGYEY